MSTTIDLLGTQHQEVLEQLAVVEAALSNGQPAENELRRFAEYLDHDVVAHFDLEEQALFPVLGRYLSPEQGPLAVMNAEHADFRQLHQALNGAVGARDLPQQRHCAERIIGLLREHIAKEDGVLFPMAYRMLTAAERDEVDSHAQEIGTGAVSEHPQTPPVV